jgi:hypothetical protein
MLQQKAMVKQMCDTHQWSSGKVPKTGVINLSLMYC